MIYLNITISQLRSQEQDGSYWQESEFSQWHTMLPLECENVYVYVCVLISVCGDGEESGKYELSKFIINIDILTHIYV